MATVSLKKSKSKLKLFKIMYLSFHSLFVVSVLNAPGSLQFNLFSIQRNQRPCWIDNVPFLSTHHFMSDYYSFSLSHLPFFQPSSASAFILKQTQKNKKKQKKTYNIRCCVFSHLRLQLSAPSSTFVARYFSLARTQLYRRPPSLQYYKQSILYKETLHYMNTAFTAFFSIECMLKIISFGVRVSCNPLTPYLIDLRSQSNLVNTTTKKWTQNHPNLNPTK